MTTPRHIGVIDIGKTNAKVALVDLATRTEIAVETTPNRILPGPPWPHHDTEGL
ncbi:MAG: rhamnose kinase RhaK, partial [Pseudomonadota bacterium]